MKPLIVALSVCVLILSIPVSGTAKLITLFEDDAAFADQLTNKDKADVAVEKADVFKGSAAIKVSANDAAAKGTQTYNPKVANWAWAIVEKPAADTEARWVAFAWKQTGGTGIMVQFPDNGNWGAVTTPFVDPPAPGTRRYIAGENLTGWSGIQVSKDVPAKWTVVVRDLFADFDKFTLSGIALTVFTNVGIYDSIYLGASEAEVRAATGGATAVEPVGKLATSWASLKTR